jgi:predicted nuclease with TOPRIM domain
MDPSERVIQILIGTGSIVVSTAVSLALGQWFNRREVANREKREERKTEVDEFAEHRQAFKERIVYLEAKCRELEDRISHLGTRSTRLEEELEDAEREKLSLMRTNFNLQNQLDMCREGRSSGPSPRQESA